MPPISLPFLYQTRTIQHALRLVSFTRSVRLAHSVSNSGEERRDNSIPFDWQDELHKDFTGSPSSAQSTITPSEAEVFKGIFDEISQGRMPATKKRPSTHLSGKQPNTAGSPATVFPDFSASPIVNHARVSEFREKFLGRYPASLRNAAQVALGLFEVPADQDSETASYMELNEANATGLSERAKHDELLLTKQTRVDLLLDQCLTDVDLWRTMEEEVFSLPKRLGITQSSAKSASGKETSEAEEAEEAEEADELTEAALVQKAAEDLKEHKKMLEKAVKWAKMSAGEKKRLIKKKRENELIQTFIDDKNKARMEKKMLARQAKKAKQAKRQQAQPKPNEEPITDRRLLEIYGRLYPHFIHKGLMLFDTKFARSSPYAFMILPRLRELGLPSYVLGISTPFYTKLASIFWTRYGDSNSALSVLNEMLQTGLYASDESQAVVESIRDHVHGCAGGSQGPFVMAMMSSSPYDANFAKRLDTMHQSIRTSIQQEGQDRA